MGEEEVAEEEWAEVDVETFIAEHELDEGAAAALRGLSPEMLQAVLWQGAPTGTNPNKIMMARIRTAKEEMQAEGETDVDTFLAEVDSRAKESFMAQTDAVQQAVMEEGFLSGSNPSAILMCRVRQARDALGVQTTRRGGKRAKASEGSTPAAVAKPAKAAVPAPKGPVRQSPKAAGPSWAGGGAEDAGSWPLPAGATQNLATLLCQVNSAVWNFELPREDLVALFKEVLKERKVVADALAGDGEAWLDEGAEGQPPQKKARG